MYVYHLARIHNFVNHCEETGLVENTPTHIIALMYLTFCVRYTSPVNCICDFLSKTSSYVANTYNYGNSMKYKIC